jgi:DNA-binding transcriptional MerR regulator
VEERPPETREVPAHFPDEEPDPTGERFGEAPADSGWVTTKQAAKALGVSRRSVQSYVRRGLLRANEEGEGTNKRFLVSIDSLNSMIVRRREDAEFAEASPEAPEAANPTANIGEGLRHVVDRLEARTAEATELRVRLELTERAESTLRAELEEESRRREQAERERDELAARLASLEESREAPQTFAEGAEGQEDPFAEEDRPERSWWRRWFGFE